MWIHFLYYQQDIQYRCVLFHPYSWRYLKYCETHRLMGEMDDFRHEVGQYEKRVWEYHDRIGV